MYPKPERNASQHRGEGTSHRNSQSLAETTPPRPESSSQSTVIIKRPREIQLDITARSSPACRRVAFRCPRCGSDVPGYRQRVHREYSAVVAEFRVIGGSVVGNLGMPFLQGNPEFVTR